MATWTQFTFSDIFFCYEYIHSHLQQIFIYIQGHNFYSTLAFFIQRFFNVQYSQIPHPVILNDLIFFHEHIHSHSGTFATNIHSHSTTIFFIQHCCNITVQYFVRTPLQASLDPRSCLWKHVFLKTQGYQTTFFLSQWTLLAYTPRGYSKTCYTGRLRTQVQPLTLRNQKMAASYDLWVS